MATGDAREPATAWHAAIALATGSFALAVAAFWVRPFAASPHPRRLYANYPNLDEDATRIMLANAAVQVYERNEPLVSFKSGALRASLSLLSLSVLTLVLALVM